AFPTATVDQIREAITGGAVDLYKAYRRRTPVEAQGRGLLNLYASYLILNRTMNSIDPSEVLEMSLAPRTISDVNYVYRAHVKNQTKTLPFFIHSSRNVTIFPVIGSNSKGIEFPQLPTSIEVTSGLTKFNLTITVNSTILNNELYFDQQDEVLLDPQTHIYFIENQTGKVLQNANFSYFPSANGFTRFEQSNILFDTTHDNDTPSAYFGGHNPRGQFSTFTGILEDDGHKISEHREGELTTQILKPYDLLILANPDLPFTSNEIDAIQEFVIDDGKSLFIIAGGGILLAEEFDYAPFNRDGINSILSLSGLQVVGGDTDETATIAGCENNNNEERRFECHKYGKIVSDQEVFSRRYTFPNYGPELGVVGMQGVTTNVIATQDKLPVILSAEHDQGKGRILLFSSPLLFDNQGLIYNYDPDGSELDNREIVDEAIDWLLIPRSMKTTYSVNGKILEKRNTMRLYETVPLQFSVTYPNGTLLSLGQELMVSIRQHDPNVVSGYYPFYLEYLFVQNINTPGTYQFPFYFFRYGTYDFYIQIYDPDGELIPTNGHVQIFVTPDDYDDQGSVRAIAFYLFLAVVFSWILWVMNEGGRISKFKKQKKDST
ncbi:MAG: hypothetical protein ACXAD7_28505, partial [Candidatus Kariarchaeaceae archaeon]